MTEIVITETEGLRLMRFGTQWCQGAMRISDPDHLEMEYAARMFGWLLFRDPDRVAGLHLVTLGLGAGSLTRFAHRVLRMQACVVEIDRDVIDACRTHFMLPTEGDAGADGLRMLHADAGEYIARPDVLGTIDVLQVDAYDASVDEPVLDSEAFYAHGRASLRAGGTVAVNLMGRDLSVRGSVGRLRAGLQPRAVWQFPPTQSGNVVVIAHCGEVPSEDALAQRARRIEERWGLPAGEWLAMVRRT